MNRIGPGAVLAAAALLAACEGSEPAAMKTPVPAQPPASDSRVRIIAFGDSLTAGKDLPDPDQEAYPAVLQRRLRERGHGVEVVNAGHSGDTTFDALNRLDYTLGEGADLVLVAFGANDTFQGKKLADVEKNLSRIVERVKKKRGDVLLLGMKTFPNLGPSYAGGFEDIFPRVAARHGVPLVPFFLEGVAGAPAMNLEDGIHPNPRGHERMAENLLPQVETWLRKRPGVDLGRR